MTREWISGGSSGVRTFRSGGAFGLLLALLAATGCGRAVVDPRPAEWPQGVAVSGGPVIVESSPPLASIPANAAGFESAQPSALSEVPRVPASAIIGAPQKRPAHYHEVARGETLSSVARRYGVSVETLLEVNGLDPGVVLQPGQRLFVPGPVRP